MKWLFVVAATVAGLVIAYTIISTVLLLITKLLLWGLIAAALFVIWKAVRGPRSKAKHDSGD